MVAVAGSVRSHWAIKDVDVTDLWVQTGEKLGSL